MDKDFENFTRLVRAMRDALSDACYAMFNFLKTQSGGYEEMAIALDKARAALAAPPRNCDRFATPAEAHIAFQRFCRGNYRPGYAAAGLDGCDDCKFCEAKNERGEDACPFLWLFAPAEGGAE